MATRLGIIGSQSARGVRARKLGSAAGLIAAVALLGSAAPASAGLRKDFSVFYDCPVAAPNVGACLVSTTTSGEFKLGSKDVAVNKTIVLQGGYNGVTHQLTPAADGNTLSKTPLTVPGGLVGIEGLGGEVTATAELAGSVGLDLENLGTNNPAITLPVKVKLGNPILGEECYLGSNSEPAMLQLMTGTTSPPGPNKPITGSKGTAGFLDHSQIAVVSGSSLVDNSFAAPGANGCEGILAPIVDPIVDLDAGVPAAAGSNTAILNGGFEATAVRTLLAEEALPQVGRCVKAPSNKENKKTVFHGRYEFSNCVFENDINTGKFEWMPGPGPNSKFSGAAGATTLETASFTKIACSAATTAGEFTGPKAATMVMTLTGCKDSANGQACQSSGALAGEIVTSSLAGRLDFIQDFYEGETLHVSLGLALEHQPDLLTAQCGAQALAVSGSVIVPVSTIDKMSSSLTMPISAAGPKQIPEQFEEEAKNTLSATLGSGSAEAAGLTSKLKATSEEKLELKAATE